jgi:hypothetical protein
MLIAKQVLDPNVVSQIPNMRDGLEKNVNVVESVLSR